MTGRDCVRLQSKWLENNRAVCPVGSAGRKLSIDVREGGREKKTGKIERGMETRCTTESERGRGGGGGVETTHRWQRIEKRVPPARPR